MSFKRFILEVRALQLDEDSYFSNEQGTHSAEAGSYIVILPGGHTTNMSAEKFEYMGFEPVEPEDELP